MPDIFISYSSKDREHAQLLTEMLSSAGLSVWIDKAGIDVATSWSEEIVDAIDACKAFIVMLSPHSISSHNVVKEVSLASEKRKKILPLDLEPVELPKNLQYALAGIQRAPMTNIDAIIRALGKLGLEATGAPQAPTIVKKKSDRQTLMVLPFKDLSPTTDNGWFADGIVSELISSLSHLKALRLIDQKTSFDFKTFTGKTTDIARDLGVRYFVEGSVRKFGDQIKIAVQLLDIEEGEYLWQYQHKGTMDEIFDIQETVAQKVVEGLPITLTKEEKSKISERGTDNEEAWEYVARAQDLRALFTKSALLGAVQLYRVAIELDPQFEAAYGFLARTLLQIHEVYEKDAAYLEEAESLLHRSNEIGHGQTNRLAWGNLYRVRGDLSAAEQELIAYTKEWPQDSLGYNQLGFFYYNTERYSEALTCFERLLSIQTSALDYWNAIINAYRSGNETAMRRWIDEGLPVAEKWVRLHPEDVWMKSSLAQIYHLAGRSKDFERLATELEADSVLDAQILVRLAGVRALTGDTKNALRDLQRAAASGYTNVAPIMTHSNFDSLRSDPEFMAIIENMKSDNA